VLKIKEDTILLDIIKDKNITFKKPLLVIIIDDISNRRQLKKILSLPYHITPSIFPPSNMNNHSNLLAKGLKHYMIHLPMESKSRVFNSMRKTLKTKDSKKVIADRIKEIRRLFPTAKYINNHTGSVFTSNYKAMNIAYKEILDNGFIFLDSVTTNKSIVKELAKVYKRPYLKRDVFLDNIQTIPAILKQLKIAIFIAKKRGYAIAIGHPHKNTFKALKRAKRLLSSVKVVYIDELYKMIYE